MLAPAAVRVLTHEREECTRHEGDLLHLLLLGRKHNRCSLRTAAAAAGIAALFQLSGRVDVCVSVCVEVSCVCVLHCLATVWRGAGGKP